MCRDLLLGHTLKQMRKCVLYVHMYAVSYFLLTFIFLTHSWSILLLAALSLGCLHSAPNARLDTSEQVSWTAGRNGNDWPMSIRTSLGLYARQAHGKNRPALKFSFELLDACPVQRTRSNDMVHRMQQINARRTVQSAIDVIMKNKHVLCSGHMATPGLAVLMLVRRAST